MDGFKNARGRDIGKNTKNVAEIATVTSSGNEINAEGAGEYREVPLVSPFGIKYNPPANTNIELIKNWNSGENAACLGVLLDEEVKTKIEGTIKTVDDIVLDPGELLLFSLGGAMIKLSNDGAVLINNHFKINKDGTTETI